jgi:hypothetical protein
VNEAREWHRSETPYATKARELHRSEYRKLMSTQRKLEHSITPKLSTLYATKARECITPKLSTLYATKAKERTTPKNETTK